MNTELIYWRRMVST